MVVREKIEQEDDMVRYHDHLSAKICATIAEPHRDSSKHPDPFTASDFLSFPPKEQPVELAEPMTEEMIRRTVTAMRAWVTTTGGQLNG